MKKFLITLCALLAFTTAAFCASPKVQKIIDDTVKATQAELPLSVDDYTILWGFSGNDDTVTYHYAVTVTSEDIDGDAFKEAMIPQLVQVLKSSKDPTIKSLMKNKVTFEHKYYGVDGVVIADLLIGPDLY